MEDHNEQFIRFIEKNKPVRISEVGGGSGDLARMSSIEWRMYEPHPPNEISTYRDIDFIRDFYSHNNARESIVFSHVLEHLRFPKQMISDIYSSDTEKNILAWPQLDKWVEDGIPGAINYEHFFYCTYETLIEFFDKWFLNCRTKKILRITAIFFVSQKVRKPLNYFLKIRITS